MSGHSRLHDEESDGEYVASPVAVAGTDWPEPIPGPVGDSATGFGGGRKLGLFERIFALILPGTKNKNKNTQNTNKRKRNKK